MSTAAANQGSTKKSFELAVLPRTEGTGTSACKKCRRDGFIPAVAYRRGEKSVDLKVPYKEFVRLASQARSSQVFTLKSDDKTLNGQLSIVKEVQRDYLKNRVLHVDFQTLREDEAIRVRIPVKLIGEAPGVKIDGGILTIVTHELGVRCLPKDIPDSIEVDITSLRLGESIHAKTIPMPTRVELADDGEETVVSVVAVRAEIEAAAAAVEGAPAEGAAAAAATPEAAKAGAAGAKAPAPEKK